MKQQNSYTDILIYTTIVLGIMLLYKLQIISYTIMAVFLIVALAAFILFNFRNGIKKFFLKK